MAFVSNTKVGRSAMLASLDETNACECLETKIHGSRTGIQRCNLQVSGLKTTSSTSKAITFCSILFSWDVLGYAFLSQGPTLSISRFFEGRIIFSQTIAAFAEDILLRGITGRYTERNHQEMLLTTTSTLR